MYSKRKSGAKNKGKKGATKGKKPTPPKSFVPDSDVIAASPPKVVVLSAINIYEDGDLSVVMAPPSSPDCEPDALQLSETLDSDQLLTSVKAKITQHTVPEVEVDKTAGLSEVHDSDVVSDMALLPAGNVECTQDTSSHQEFHRERNYVDLYNDIPPCDLGSSGEGDDNDMSMSSTPHDQDGMSESEDDMRNFFPATRVGFKEVAGKVTRVTRADFDDYNRRRHLECFARSMESWKNFELRHNNANQLSLSALNFDRYRDVFVDIDVNTLSTLDQFIYHLLTSSDNVMDQPTLTSLMAKLRRRFHITPSKRDIFERLLELQNAVALKKATETGDSTLTALALKHQGESVLDDQSKAVKYDSKMQHLLRIKGTRSNSGVVVITVLTAPGNFSCASDCYYCPNEPGQPRSYLSTEPAVLRANQNDFDAVKQFYDRAMTLYRNGHIIDKIEILVLGGTWSGYPRQYQEEFCRDLYYAANIFPEQIDYARERKSLSEEQDLNEKAECRIIGLTLETRPDRITPVEIKSLRMLGCTRVQLGIQHTNDDVLNYVNRGHTLNDTIRALYLLKENAYKVDIHIMPDLPSSSPTMDNAMFALILSDEGLQADQWKIYPCEVAPFSKIEEWHKEGKYVPYFDTDPTLMTNLLMRVKRSIHPWIRLNRLIRDIPNPSIIAGTNITNMRQLVLSYMSKRSIACHCIRCREVKGGNIDQSPKLMVRQYETTGGTEFFLSYESEDESKIYGFLRLRIRTNAGYNPKVSLFRCLEGCAFIRELHVYGIAVAHGKSVKETTPCQHRGIGASLLLAAEIVGAAKGVWKMAVIAGIGTREYYAKHGYVVEDTYMIKHLTSESISKRFNYQKTLKHSVSIRIPNSVRIYVMNLHDAVTTLNLPLPEPHEGKNPPPPIFEQTTCDNYSINVNRLLGYTRGTNDAAKDYTKEKTIIFDEYLAYVDSAMDSLGDPIKFVQDHPVLVASVTFVSLLCLIKLRNGMFP